MRYRDAGVDVDKAAGFIDRIKPMVETTRRAGWLDSLGGFGSLFRLDVSRYRQPVLVSGTDGVGTKLRLAQAAGIHHTIGIDLVAMCANDVLAQGAEPLFFLDYLAMGALSVEVAEQLVRGMAEGCRQAGCSLVGGETAEMPGVYAPGEYDLAGFVVGVVEEDRLIDGRTVAEGDLVMGLASSGLHSNGFSLVRSILGSDLEAALERRAPWSNEPLARELLKPTTIYVRAVLPLVESGAVHGLVHVTGGGLPDNLARVLPGNLDAVLDASSWPVPPVFDFLAREGNVDEPEMRRVFNMGLGYLLVVSPGREGEARRVLEENGQAVYLVGRVETGSGRVRFS